MKYKAIISILIILVNLKCKTSQSFSVNNKLEIIQDFKIGKTYNYVIQKTNEEEITENQLLNIPKINVSLEINSFNDTFKICSWNYGNFDVPETNIETYSKDLENIFKGISLKFKLNPKGIFEEITNYEEAKKGLVDMLLKRGKLTTVDFNEASHKQIIEAISFTFDSPELLIQSYFEEIPIFFSLFGEIIDIDSINIDSVMMPDGISNNQLKGIVLTEVSELSHPNIKITQKRVFNKGTLADFISSARKKLPKNGGNLKELEILEQGGVTILTNYYYNYVDRILMKVESTKTSIYNKNKVIKTTIIKYKN